jgi:hypothetical protein
MFLFFLHFPPFFLVFFLFCHQIFISFFCIFPFILVDQARLPIAMAMLHLMGDYLCRDGKGKEAAAAGDGHGHGHSSSSSESECGNKHRQMAHVYLKKIAWNE